MARRDCEELHNSHNFDMPRGKKITIECRVSGRFGPLVDPPVDTVVNTDGKRKRRVRLLVYGTVVGTDEYRKWSIRLDHDGTIRNGISSNQLKVVDNPSEGVPIGMETTVRVHKLLLICVNNCVTLFNRF